MGQKVTFNPVTKIIQVDIAPVGGVVELDIKVDIYSDGKEDWKATPELFKLRFPLRSVGGDATPTGVLGSTFFLTPPWKIRPYEADHVFRVSGNFFSEDGTSPFATTVGAYNIFLEQSLSNLVDTVSSGSGLSASQEIELNETWRLAGLDKTNPMTVTPTTRVAGDIDLIITGDGETTSTVTRQ